MSVYLVFYLVLALWVLIKMCSFIGFVEFWIGTLMGFDFFFLLLGGIFVVEGTANVRCLTTRTTSWCSVRGARTGKKLIWVLLFVLFLSVLKLGLRVRLVLSLFVFVFFFFFFNVKVLSMLNVNCLFVFIFNLEV